LATLTEGTDPAGQDIEVEGQNVTLDQWGDIITISDVAELTTKHPLLTQANELLADNAQRVIDREVQTVWMAGTNVQYGDASVTSRRSITSGMKMSDTVITQARITLSSGGAKPRSAPGGEAIRVKAANAASSLKGPQHFVAICSNQVAGDISAPSTSLGTWASTAMYNSAMSLYNGEVGTWLGIRWVESNFVPIFRRLGNDTAAVVSGNAFGTDTPVVTAVDGGGTLTSATTYYYKVTRKDKLRGFEEYISLAHSTASTATANNESFTFDFSALTAGYVYNLYFGTSAADADLKLHTANIAVGTTVTVTAVPASTTTPPDNTGFTGGAGIAIHPVFIHGANSTNWVGLQDLRVYLTKDESTIGNVLRLKRAVGYKFLGKAMIRNQNFMLRVEVASAYV
jgi:N4-gp56 family major capsid protein